MRKWRNKYNWSLLIMRTIATCAFVLLLGGCAPTPPKIALAASAPRTCSETRGAYCIESVGLAIHVEKVSPTVNRIRVFEDHWQGTPLTITEPASCGSTRSDTVETLHHEKANDATKLRLRLVRNGSCDIDIAVAGKARDPAGHGFFTAMTQIRACERAPCEGPVIGGIIRQELDF